VGEGRGVIGQGRRGKGARYCTCDRQPYDSLGDSEWPHCEGIKPGGENQHTCTSLGVPNKHVIIQESGERAEKDNSMACGAQ
jgi:hypothetical protein